METARNGNGKLYLFSLSLTALGVVYGDIGTSPLYALRECFHGPRAIAPTHENVLGVLSLIFWSLLIVISFKYLALIMRADNEGEGGILALLALVRPPHEKQSGFRNWLMVILGLFGAALLYGDGMITPAISVLSAIEGLEVATPVLGHFIEPITIAILVALFAVQRRGTAGLGFVFGPIMLLWFSVLAVLGAVEIAVQPHVLAALSPYHAVAFFLQNGVHGLIILGVVFLVVTGGEALYADMGHFGKKPIRLAWFAFVLPALLVNYFGQGALLLTRPEWAKNPFYHLAPSWALYPMVMLSTAATVIASQAVISGAYSLTMQAVQLGYLPRLTIKHTSETEYGQIYVPLINWILLASTVFLVLAFRTSSNLAAAYGVAVTTTMVITTLLAYVVMRDVWRWSIAAAFPLTAVLLAIDLAFFGANVIKIPDGGWFPLLIGLVMLTIMSTWRLGREILAQRIDERSVSYEELFERLKKEAPVRVPGTAVYLYSNPHNVPPALIRNLDYNRALHEKIIVVSALSARVPYVRKHRRVESERLGPNFHRVRIHYGFMEKPDIPKALQECRLDELTLKLGETAFVLGRETLLATDRPGMALWRERLFSLLTRNAARATTFYGVPPERVLEIGAQIEL